ncbi:hypothetical protein OH492_12910 [Vibrio chagasii]|nr:hypothetical protein [Vibrio chagasii]
MANALPGRLFVPAQSAGPHYLYRLLMFISLNRCRQGTASSTASSSARCSSDAFGVLNGIFTDGSIASGTLYQIEI